MENKHYWKNRSIKDKRRDWNYKSDNWLYDYIYSAIHPHRNLIIKELKKIKPKSLLELGCNCGPNLLRIGIAFKDIKLAGIDINKSAMESGKYFLEGISNEIILKCGDYTKLPFKNKSYDAILADATLIYANPKEIKKTVNEINRVVKNDVLLCEWYSKKEMIKDFHWARDYKKIFEEKGFKVKIIKFKKGIWPTKSGNWERNGRLFVCHRQYPISEKNLKKE